MAAVGFQVHPDKEKLYEVVRTQDAMPKTGHHHIIVSKLKLDTGLLEVFNMLVHPVEGPQADSQLMTQEEYENFLEYVIENAPFGYNRYDMTVIEDVADQIQAFQDLIADIFQVEPPEDFYPQPEEAQAPVDLRLPKELGGNLKDAVNQARERKKENRFLFKKDEG